MAVEERVYQSQVGPGTTAPMPLGNSAITDAIGGGMERLGGQLVQGQRQDYEIERKLNADREASDFNVRFAKARAKFDQFSIDRRNAAPADAAGHVEAMSTAWDAEQAVLLEGIAEEGLKNNAKAQLAQFGERLASSEYDWQEAKRVGKVVTDQQQLSDVAANRARLSHDPASYAEELTLGHQGIEAMTGVPADVRDKLIKAHDQSVTVGYLNGLNDKNPQVALALIDGGAFNEILEPQQLEQARNGAQIEVRRAEAAAAHQLQLQSAAVREQVQGLKAQVEAGVDVPDTVLAQAQTDLAGIGDTGGATQLGLLRIQNGVRRETETWTPAQFETEINRLSGKKDRSPSEDVQLTALIRQRPSAVATYNNNPGEWAAKNGMPPPSLNLSDPGSIAGRLAWARSVETTTGRPVAPLLAAEVGILREQAASSPNARVAVADQIAMLGGYATLQAARQIAPNDPMLGRLAQLGDPMLRRSAAKGAEIRAARKDVIDGVNGNDAREDFDQALGGAGTLMAPGDLGAAYEVARNIYASRADGINYSQQAFDQAAHEALGGTFGAKGERLGGIGTHGRTPVLLPPGMSDATFDKTIARMASVRFGGPNQPTWADGSTMTPAQLRNFTPVRRPDGWYEFHDGSGARATVKGGGTFKIDLARLGQRWFP